MFNHLDFLIKLYNIIRQRCASWYFQIMKIEFWYFIIGELPILVIPCSYGLQVSGGPCFEFYLLSQISPPLKCVYTHNKPTYILVTLDICMKKYIFLFVQIGQLVSITHHSSTTDFRIELICNWIYQMHILTKLNIYSLISL